MNRLHKAVLLGAIALFGAWLAVHMDRIMIDEDGLIRFVLGLLFAILILLRWKAPDSRSVRPELSVIFTCSQALRDG